MPTVPWTEECATQKKLASGTKNCSIGGVSSDLPKVNTASYHLSPLFLKKSLVFDRELAQIKIWMCAEIFEGSRRFFDHKSVNYLLNDIVKQHWTSVK